MPFGPGTFGTLAALPLWWWTASLAWPATLTFLVAFILFSIRDLRPCGSNPYGTHDVRENCIDEVAGILVTSFAVPFAWPQVLAGFYSFVSSFVVKPPPVRWFDKHVDGGFGVVIDDVVAGALACGVYLARLGLGGWW
ncbi:MAG: phosphatidylglycerophosphatase A [Myxococcota bacterium]